MRILAVTNVKGGVGKTTTAVNLAHLAAAAGRRTVLWDLDPQAASTWLLRCDRAEELPVRKLVSGKREVSEFVVQTPWSGLAVIPSDLACRRLEPLLAEKRHPTERLLRMSRALRDACDLLVLDCPPGLSLLTENVLHAADRLVVPVLPSPLSVRLIDVLQGFVDARGWTDLRILPFFSMVDRRRALHAESIADTRARLPTLLATEVPYSSEIERMTQRRMPLAAYAPGSAAASIYRALWAEVDGR